MDEQSPGRAVEAVGGLLKRGILRYFDKSIGNQTEAGRSNRFQKWLQERTQAVKSFINESFTTALLDKEVQNQGTEFVAHTVGEAVQGIRENFGGTLKSVNEGLKSAPEDTRSTYARIRDVLGHSKDDKWYTKIGKNALARVFSWALPVISYVSARMAGKISDKEKPSDVAEYRKTFQSIYDRLLSKMSPNQPTQATA